MTEPYKSAAAVEAAIRDAAQSAFVADKSMSTQDRIRQEHFRRFLSRIFSERDDSDWLLKGGTGVLARVASGRRTTDVDLFRANNTLDGALGELIRLASLDLGDFFRFVYTKHQSAVAGDQQTHTEGYGVDFDVYIGADKKEPLHVDLVVGAIITDEVTITRHQPTASTCPGSPATITASTRSSTGLRTRYARRWPTTAVGRRAARRTSSISSSSPRHRP